MEFHSIAGDLPHIPDDLTIPDFILNSDHELRPKRPEGVPWLIADKSGKRVDLSELQMRTKYLTASLHDQFSLRKNDAVLVFSSNHIDYPVCVWAIHQLLGIVVPFNPTSTVSELVQHLKLSKAVLVISHEDSLTTAYAAAREIGIPETNVIVLEDQDKQPRASRLFGNSKTVEQLIRDGSQSKSDISAARLGQGEGKTQVAFYSSSSGTTGVPKIVKISHYAVIANVLQMVVLNKVGPSSPKYRPGDRCLGVLPFYHIYGIVPILHFNFFSAISLVVVPKFNFVEMLQSIQRYKINSLMVVPPQVVLLCKENMVKDYDLTHIRMILCAAAPLAGELYDQLIQLVPHAYIGQAYGSTEATGVVSMSHMLEKHGRYGGILAPGISGRVVKHDGTLATYDEEGELHIKTPAAAIEYLDNKSANLETFLHDSWMRTGDLVRINAHEEIIVVDRVKEMIKVRGFQVAPAELEGCLLDHPYVADACVVGVPHKLSGEAPFAFITLTEEGKQNPETIVKLSINKHIAVYKAPFKQLYRIEITSSIPKTPSGKLLRRELRAQGKALLEVGGKL